MTDKNSIRLLWRQGDSVAEIARKTGVSRDTVYKYRDMDDFSPKPPARRAQGSKLDPYRPLIESWLDDDMRSGRKQRHTAKRVHDRLVSECGADVSVSTVERCVREIRARRSAEAADAQYLDLVWGPGEAQADFGEADFYVRGMRTTLSFFVMTFPYSNVGLAQVFPGETSECVCQALRNVFEHVGGVPTKIVFDNATGVGRRVGGGVRTTELFAACSAHYGFRFRFCNPRSGNEKGSVENKVGCVRRNLFVPVPQLWDAGAFNRRLLERSLAMSDKPHWIKGERELDLFEADRLAMLGLPAKPLDCVTYVSRTADKKGKVSVGEWIGYTDVDSSGRGAGDGRAVYEGPQAPEAFHRRVQEADSRPLQRRQAQARDHGRVRPRQEHRGEVDQVDKRDRLAARRGQPHARAEPDPGARAREPQAPDGGRRLKTSGADIRSKVRAIAANEGRYPISAQCRLLGVARSTYYSMRSRADRPAAPDPAAPAVVAAHAASKGRYGSRKIKASLERSGVTVSRRRVCRIIV